MKLNVPYKKQPDNYSCGAACVKMLADYYQIKNPKTKKLYSYADIKKMCNTTIDGTEFSGINSGFRKLGLKKRHAMLSDLENFETPIIALIPDPEIPEEEDHYIVLTGISKKGLIYHDPYYGKNKIFKIPDFFKAFPKRRPWIWAVEKR